MRGRAGHEGLSPRVRGNHVLPIKSDGRRVYPRACGGTPYVAKCRSQRSIPARAGEPLVARSGGLSPRVRGNRATIGTGLSPRVRGNHPAPGLSTISGITGWVYPRACGGPCYPAGSSNSGADARAGGPRRLKVYPRACGGTVARSFRQLAAHHGSIPARAGEPNFVGGLPHAAAWVYPRACGGTDHHPASGAGQQPVYPRACGGTPPARAGLVEHRGLSPRVRGNPQRLAKAIIDGLSPRVRGNPARMPACRAHGSIPARAGEPAVRPPSQTGSSPRVRSIPARAGEPAVALSGAVIDVGSIPARAGEPPVCPRRFSYSPASRVYPRACGGTHKRQGRRQGLSPRVRGNRPQSGTRVAPTGSIPARAGEPSCDAADCGL